jgi:integrase
MMKARLEDEVIRAEQARQMGRRITLTDTEIAGFFVEVRERSATFGVRLHAGGRVRVQKLGNFPEMSTEEARTLCLARKAELARAAPEAPLGADAGVAPALTLERFYTDHYLPWYKTYRRNSANVEQLYRSIYRPRFGRRLVGSISRDDLKLLTSEMLADDYAPGSINLTIVVLRSMLRRADDWGVCAVHPSIHKPPNRLPDTRQHERFLSREEALRLQAELKRRGATPVTLAILFLMYTGARKNEALKAEWRHVNLERREWRIPLSKNGRPRTVILSHAAMDILAQARRYQTETFGEGATHVAAIFANPHTQRPFHTIFQSWKRIRSAVGLEDLRLHDLRHSYASTLVNAGVSIYEIQKLLGHSNIATTQRYAHLASERLHETVKLVDAGYGRG